MYILDLEFIPGTYPAVASGNNSVATVDGKRIVFVSHNPHHKYNLQKYVYTLIVHNKYK